MKEEEKNMLVSLLEKLLGSSIASSDSIIYRTAKGLVKKLQTIK